jgi:hypothetical protein
MHAIATRPSPRVQKERFSLLITIQNGIEISASQQNKHNISTHTESQLPAWIRLKQIRTCVRRTSHDAGGRVACAQ